MGLENFMTEYDDKNKHKTLNQKIADAEARLARLRLETRKRDTGRMIVLGGILFSAAERDPTIRTWLLKQVDADKLRKVDAERLAPLIAKWREESVESEDFDDFICESIVSEIEQSRNILLCGRAFGVVLVATKQGRENLEKYGLSQTALANVKDASELTTRCWPALSEGQRYEHKQHRSALPFWKRVAFLAGSIVVDVLYTAQDILGPVGDPFKKASQAIYRWRNRQAVAEQVTTPSAPQYIEKLSQQVAQLRGLLLVMGFDPDRLLEPGGETSKMILLSHVTLDEERLIQTVGADSNIDAWRSSWAYFRRQT